MVSSCFQQGLDEGQSALRAFFQTMRRGFTPEEEQFFAAISKKSPGTSGTP
jgi:hypothetical protein